MKIINLTQQIAQGVIDLPEHQRIALVRLLTVDTIPSWDEIEDRCADIAELACHNGLGGDDGEDPHPTSAMVGGAPSMMVPLEAALRSVGIQPVYSLSRRESVDQHQPDGSVRKVAIFKHAGWRPVPRGDSLWDRGKFDGDCLVKSQLTALHGAFTAPEKPGWKSA